MRFPLRLIAELARAKIVRMGRGKSGRPLVLRIAAPADAGEESSNSPISNSAADEEILKQVRLSGAPIVWMGGTAEPLAYCGAGHLARRIAELGGSVFVETDGGLLRRRIFSFRPAPQVYLAVQLNGTERVHDRRAKREGVYRGAMEGIRAAQLSGFLICAKTAMYEDTEMQDIAALRKNIEMLGLDGWVVTHGRGVSQSDGLKKTLEAAREMSGGRWAAFSRLIEEAEELQTANLPALAGVSVDEQTREEAYEQEVRVP